jgi:DNA-binding protein H-NS
LSKYEEIQNKIAELQKQADELYTNERKTAIQECKEKIKLYDLTASDLGLSGAGRGRKPAAKKSAGKTAATKGKTTAAKKGRKATRKPVKKADPKFIGPNGETWAGRGKQPNWLSELINAGASLDDFRI